MLNKHAAGAIMIIAGAICYGMPGIILSLALRHGAHTSNIIATQYLFSFILFFVLSEFTRNKKATIPTREKAIALFTGMPLLGVTYCFFQSVFYIGVPTATLLMMQSSWIVPLINAIIRRTPVARKDILLLLCIITGVAIATGVFRGSMRLNIIGISWGLGAALCYSLVILSSSQIAKESRVIDKARLLTLGAFITAICVMKDNVDISPFTTDSYWSLLTAVFSSILPVLLFGLGMPRTAPSLAGMLVTIELPAAYVFSYLILAEKINIDQIVGCLIIVLSLVVPGLIGKYKSR
ncbi:MULTISPECIES: DMT family transporter [Tatumella]|uniref:DMT family transporter n=1 Tax=Tatumella punctata TaxID=399969 RepID=A0ABW1VR05_9GAMM|nr:MULTISPECIES: DMT family transporter [unclassified Tatumella]MBS0856038.1 DMT family transporter [Tatumella sp. JGM16]MBS0878097.1 DMT family transporter [Tatumella sp. JGM82]MBS0890456.1 DMT family transporter [Tatumella sp. JGM94]MBS0894655.1 DMT family transporter [Tatumella sp. JGM130]MBS0900912.1 DMT family transporter [Tatumella sp. JGM100]